MTPLQKLFIEDIHECITADAMYFINLDPVLSGPGDLIGAV